LITNISVYVLDVVITLFTAELENIKSIQKVNYLLASHVRSSLVNKTEIIHIYHI